MSYAVYILIQFFFLLRVNTADAGLVYDIISDCLTSDCFGTCTTIDYAVKEEHRIFASISELVYNEPKIDFLDEYGNHKFLDNLGTKHSLTGTSPLRKWKHVHEYKHTADTTYEILIYKHIDEDNYIVGLRGTYDLRDIITDAFIVTGTLGLSERFIRTRDKIKAFFSTKTYIGKIQYTGHGLGGALAVEMMKYTQMERTHMESISEDHDTYAYSAIIFNAAASCLGYIDTNWDITSIRTYGDPVSALGRGLYKTQITISEEYMKNNNIIPPNYLTEKGHPDNYIQTHAMSIFVECPEGLHRTSSDLLPICTPPGCKDRSANNYNSNAKTGDNKLCTYAGCMDRNALNFNPQASESKDECLYIEVETQAWLRSKHYDPENDELMDDELQIIRKMAAANMESMDSNAIRHSDISELQFSTPRKRYLRFEYPTNEAFDLMTSINKDECLKFGLGPPRRHLKKNKITHWDGMDTWKKITDFGRSMSETFSGKVNIMHRDIEENEIWCSIPYNATTFKTTEYNESMKEVSYVYGSEESPRENIARVMKLLELYSDKSDSACDEWNAVANGGFRYSSMQGDCEASGWGSPSKKDCDLSSDMMQWFKYYEHQPLTYICGGEVYFSRYQDEAVDLEDYYNNELVQWTGTDLLNHFDLFGFYVISKNGTTLEDFIDNNPNAHAQDIHNKLQEIYCTEYTLEIEDCTWHQFYVPLRYVDHYTRVDHSSVANRGLMLVDIDFPDSLCKLDLRIEKDSLSAIETTTYNALQENIAQGHVSLMTWADQECYTGDLCLLGVKSIEKQDRGFAIPIPFTPVDIGFSIIMLDITGFALVYSKETKVSYCYNIHQESAEMYGPKVAVSPLAFEPFSRSVSSLKSKAPKKAAAVGSRLARNMLASAKKRIHLAKFALGRAKVKRSLSDSIAKMDIPPFRKDRLQQRIDARKGKSYAKDAAKAKAIILINGGFDSYFLRALQISFAVRDGLRYIFNGAAKGFNFAKRKSIQARDWLAGTMLGKAAAGAPALLRSMFNKRLTQLKAWRQKVKFNKLYVSTIKKNRAVALKAAKTIKIARGKKIAERLAKRHAANLAKSGRKKLQNSWKTYKKQLKREKKIAIKATVQLKREQFKRNINQLKKDQWGPLYGVNQRGRASLRLQARLQKRKLFLEKRGGNFPRGNGNAVASSGINLDVMTSGSSRLQKRLDLRRKLATSNLKGTTISPGNPVSIHALMSVTSAAMLLKKKLRALRIDRPNLGAPKPGTIPVPGSDAAKSLAGFKQFNGNAPSRRAQANPYDQVGYLTIRRRARRAAELTKSDQRLKFRTELLDKMQGKIMKRRVAVQEATARFEYRKKKIAEQRISIDPVKYNAQMKALHAPLNLNSQSYSSHLRKTYKAESISSYRKTLNNPLSAGNLRMAFIDYRRFQHQPGVQRALGRKIPDSHDPPPEEVEEVGVYPEEEVRKTIFQLAQEARVLGSMTRENFWYELGYCRNPPCPLMSRRTGFSLDSDLTVAKKGSLGKYEWSNIALEVTTFNTGVKGTAFRAVNFDSRASVAGGNGWDRTLWNGQTQLYVPGAFDAMALTSVGGFLSELLRFSLEVGVGHGLMRFRFHPPKQVDGDSENINPVTVHSNMCLSENTQMGAEDLMTRPSEQPCHDTHSHSGKIRLNYPSVEKFINCPITHYLNADECIMYDQSELPPLVQYDEHWLLGKVSTCAGNPENSNVCEMYEESGDLHSHYSSLMPDYTYVTRNIPDHQRIRDSFLYSLEYMGVRDTLHEHPYTGTRASTLPLSIITEENCEIFGLSPIYALADPGNSYVKELVKSLYVDVNISIYDIYIVEDHNGILKLNEDVFTNKSKHPMFTSNNITFDQDKLDLEDRVPTIERPHNYTVNSFVPFEHPYIPYGVSLVPFARDKFTTDLTIVHKDKGYYGYHYEQIYGREPSFDPKCTAEYKCVCFKGNEYIYTTYDIKPEKDTDYIYTYQPIMSIEECRVAATAIGNDVVTYHDRIWYHDNWLMMEEEGVTIDQTLTRVGCFKVGEEIFFNGKAYNAATRIGITANLYSDSHSASVIKVIRAKNKVVEKRTPRIVVKTPMEVLTTTQTKNRKLNPIGRFHYSGTNAGEAMIPIERNFQPFKYKPSDTDSGTDYYVLHEVINETGVINETIITYRYMKEQQSYSASNNGLIEKITSKGTINVDQYGEKENLEIKYEDATVNLGVGNEERLDYRPQIIEDVIVGVENVLAHKFAAVGTMRAFPKPIFGDIDSDADTDLLVSDELRSRHLYLSTDNYRYNLANEDSSGIDNIDLGDYITPSFVDITNVTGMDILTANRLTGEIKLWTNPGGGTTVDVDDMFEVDDKFNSIYGSSVAMFRSEGRNETQTHDLLYIGSGSWNDTRCEITATSVLEGVNESLCNDSSGSWNDTRCKITNTMILEGFNETLCDAIKVTWDNVLEECEISDIDTEWKCESLKSIFLLNCTEITHTMTYGNEYDTCQHIPHWSDSQCIFMLDNARCNDFRAVWHDMTCMRWDRLEPGVDEDTCYAENPITCLDTSISEGDSKCTLSGNSEYSVTYESCSRNNAKWTPAYCELWYTYDDNRIATRVLVESNGDCSEYDPKVEVYTYEEYNEIWDADLWYQGVNCTLYNETFTEFEDEDIPDGLDDSDSALVNWGTEECGKATFKSSTCTHNTSTSYGLTRNECRGYNPTWTHPWETKKIDCMWGDREGLGADVKTRDCNPELEDIIVTDSDSGYEVGDVITFAAVGDGSNAGDFGSFNYTLVEGDIRILKKVKTGDLSGTLPDITGGNPVARATTSAGISGGSGTGLDVDVTTLNCETVLGNINCPGIEKITVHDSAAGYEVGDVITFDTVGDGGNAGDYGSFEYTLVAEDLTPAFHGPVRKGPVRGTLPAITGSVASGTTTNADISGGGGTGLDVDVKTRDCKPGVESINVTSSGSGYEVGDIINFAAKGDGNNAGDYGSFEYTLVAEDLTPASGIQAIRTAPVSGTLPAITGGNVVSGTTNGAVISGGSGTGLDVDVTTLNCDIVIECIYVTDSGCGYEVDDVITFAAKGDGSSTGDYSSFEYTLVAEDLFPCNTLSASGHYVGRFRCLSGTLPAITGNFASGTTTNAVISGGSGTGLVVDVTTLDKSGSTQCPGLESITVKRAGSGYEVGDVITFDAVGDGSNAGDYGSFAYTLVAGDFRTLGVQTVKTGHLSGTMPTVTAVHITSGTTTSATNTGIGNTIKYGDIVNFNNTPAINTGDEIELWNGQWERLHEQPGHPAYYYDGTYLIGKTDTVEYYNRDGTLFTQYNDGKTLVNLEHIDVFYNGKLSGGGVNIDLTAIPCRALAISSRSYYLNEEQDLIEIPTHEFLTNASGELSSDNIINRVCGHLPNTTINNSISCTKSHSFPNKCPEGYGLVHSKWGGDVYNHNSNYEIPFIRGDYTQCAPCPDGTISPDGHTRCLGDEFKLVELVSQNNTNLFIDEYQPTVFATHLQKYHHSKGDAYFPTIHSQDGIDYIDNEVYSDTKFLRCNSGYVPKPKEIPDVRNSSDVKGDVLSYYSGTCSGYTCQRCPVNFIEENQRCVPCPPGKIAGWEVNRYSGAIEPDNVCITISVPTGHFMDVQNLKGVTIHSVRYPYTTHCDHWLYHPAGKRGAYQDETNQYMCKIAKPGTKAVINPDTRVVTKLHDPGQKVSNDRTQVINCTESEVCDGEQIIGCKPGHIWYRQTNDREDEECLKCNEDESIYDLHPEMDDYEYCDGTHKFQCDLGTYTEGNILDGVYAERYVGIRDTWRGSNLVHYAQQPNKSLDGSQQYVYRPDWDIEKARIQADLHWVANVAHAGEVSALANRGDTVVSGGRSYDGGQALKLWNKQTGKYIALNGQSGSINSVDIASDGKIVSASSDGSVVLWSNSGTLLRTTNHHVEKSTYNKEVNSVAFSPDGSKIVSGGVDGSVIIQDIAGALNQTLKGHSETRSYLNGSETVQTTVPLEVYAVAWGDFIVSGGTDCLRKWVGNNSTCLIDVPYVSSVAITGSTVIAAAGETIYINDTSTNITASSNVYALAFSPNGQYFVSVGDDIQIWSINRTLKRQMPQSRLRTNIEAYGHVSQRIKSVAWGTEIITGGNDRTIRIWKDWDQTNRTHVRLSMVDWHEQSKCLPVPNGHFALDREWKLRSCGFAKEHCIHRTFHRIYPFIYPTVTAPKYMFTQAVRETSYDEIFRFTDRQCLDGYLKDGCLKEYCSREGQTNCWCGEEEDFCTMACVDGMCVPACSEQVCDPDYEICLGVGDSGRCARVCVGPSDNFCVTDEGGVKVCRHYNEDWNSTRLQSLDPQPDSPCFSYMPNIPETQCKDVFENECFCNRDYLDDENYCCLDKVIQPQCSVQQDDGTCTYMPQEDLTKRDCVCGNELTEQTCYQKEGECGVYASLQRSCTELLSTIQNTRTHGIDTQCRPTGEENIINPDQCRLATDITKSFGSWDIFNESLTCTGTESFEPGCIDPHADNYNQYAVIPKKCEYI